MDGENVMVVGDTLDDAEAARTVVARAVLVTSTLHRDRLRTAGVPIVERLVDAVRML